MVSTAVINRTFKTVVCLHVSCYLQELCLHTKLLAPVNTLIADFLAKAPDPPAFLLTRNAVHILKVFVSSAICSVII